MLLAGGDMHKPVAVAQRFVGKTDLFRTEQKGNAVCAEFLLDQADTLFQGAERVAQIATADGRGSNHETAIRDGCRHLFIFLGAIEQGRGADG